MGLRRRKGRDEVEVEAPEAASTAPVGPAATTGDGADGPLLHVVRDDIPPPPPPPPRAAPAVGQARYVPPAGTDLPPPPPIGGAAPEPPKQDGTVEFDAAGITCIRRPGLVEHVAWEDIVEVSIRSVSKGNHQGHHWLIGDRHGWGIVIRAGTPEADILLGCLQALRDFDNRKVHAGLEARGDKLIVVWRER